MEPTKLDRRLLNVKEAAQYFSIGVSEMYWMGRTGQVPVIRTGKKGSSVRFPKEGLDEWVNRQLAASKTT